MSSNPYRHILPEIAMSRDEAQRTATPFRATCPACGAALVEEVNHPQVDYRRIAIYACGAAYNHKPQIQNHTEKWWGVCPATAARQGYQG